MNIVNTVHRINPKSGGVAVSILDSAAYLRSRGHTVTTYSTDDTFGAALQCKYEGIVNSPQTGQFKLASKIESNTGRSQISVCHDHGQWMPINIAAYKVSSRNHIPRVVSPHGMLRTWAFEHKKWKKRIAWSLYGRKLVKSADAVHVASETEAKELRALNVANNIHVIPLSIDMPTLPVRTGVELKTVLFMSRVHAVKGINELLEAWPKAKQPGWQLVIAGPDEEGIIRNRQLPEGCVYKGSVEGAEKWQLLVNSDLFVLPTKTENFGLAIAEALYAGLPVITTTNAPWECIETEKLGWWIDDTPMALEQALRESISSTTAQLGAMGSKGHTYVTQRFSHDRYCDALLSLYDSVRSK